MELNQLTPRQALIYDALIPPGMPVRGKELARRTRISERDLRSERKAMQEQGVPIVTGDFGYMLVDENNPEPLLRYAKRLNAHGDEELATDNIAKIMLDALNGLAYPDDKQVVELQVLKTYDLDGYVEVELTPWRAR